jgi:hypothetical protein
MITRPTQQTTIAATQMLDRAESAVASLEGSAPRIYGAYEMSGIEAKPIVNQRREGCFTSILGPNAHDGMIALVQPNKDISLFRGGQVPHIGLLQIYCSGLTEQFNRRTKGKSLCVSVGSNLIII